MKMDVDAMRDLFADHDPAGSVRGDELERRRILEVILAEAPPADRAVRGHVVTRRRIVMAGALAAAAAAATFVVVDATGLPDDHTARVSFVTTPPMLEMRQPVYGSQAREILLRLAATAAQQPDTSGHRKVSYTKTTGWHLDTAVTNHRASAAVVARTAEQWIAPDGSGRQLTRSERPWFPTAKSRKEAEKQGNPYPDAGNSDERYRPGELSLGFNADTAPTDPTALRDKLATYAGDNKGALGVLNAATDLLYGTQPVRPRLQAALLRVLADSKELGYAGTVKDRAGRKGTAFTLDSKQSGLPTRYVIIFDPHTGAALSEEEILTKDPGALPVRIPAVISYTLYLRSGRVDNTNQRP